MSLPLPSINNEQEDDDMPAEEDNHDEPTSSSFSPKNSFFSFFNEAQTPGDFTTSGELSCDTTPGIFIEGIGTIAFPLIEHQAKQIIIKSQELKQHTWYLQYDKFTIRNPRWQQQVEEMVNSKVKLELGIIEKEVSCSLQKMILIEKGGSLESTSLRISKKEEAEEVFGTLLIHLPSAYRGGETVVGYRGRQSCSYHFKETEFASHYVACYADCEYLLREVTEGYRICLVYHLLHHGQGPLMPQDHEVMMNRLRALTDQWSDTKAPQMLVYILEQADRGSDKGNDELVLNLLRDAHEQGILEVYFCALEKTTSVAEAVLRRLLFKDCMSLDNQPEESLESVKVDEEWVFPEDRYNQMTMSQPPTRHASMGLTQQYKSEALVFWPKMIAHRTWIARGAEFALDNLIERIFEAERQPSIQCLCTEVAMAAVEQAAKDVPAKMILIAACLKEEDILQATLDSIATSFTASSNELYDVIPALTIASILFGLETMNPRLDTFFTSICKCRPHTAVLLLHLMKQDTSPVVQSLIGFAHNEAIALLASGNTIDSISCKFIAKVVVSLVSKCKVKEAMKLSRTMCATQTSPNNNLVAATNFLKHDVPQAEIQDSNLPYHMIFKRVIKNYKEQITVLTRTPIDWNLHATMYCRCALCAPVQVFLNHPSVKEYKLSAVEKTRKHVASKIRQITPNVTFTTSAPSTLVCTKVLAVSPRNLEKARTFSQVVKEYQKLIKSPTPTQDSSSSLEPPNKRQRLE